MRAQARASARKYLDKRLNPLINADAFARPPRGWIKAIREALGMTTAQLAKRLGIAQPSAVGLEKAEASKAITLETLERAARALDCTLVYALVPREPLDTIVQQRASEKARARLRAISHSNSWPRPGMLTGGLASTQRSRERSSRSCPSIRRSRLP